MVKSSGRVFAASLLIVFLVANLAYAQRPEKTNLGAGFEFKFFGSNFTSKDYIKEINNVSAELRQIPSHPEDTWIYGSKQVILTVPYDSVNFGAITGFIVSLSPELTVWRFRLRSGVNFYVGSSSYGPSKANKDGTREINQYGEPWRGYGTSLVYYSIYGTNSWKPGLTHEVDLDIGKNFLLISGYGQNNYKLVAESGYDRWDALEKYRSVLIADNQLTKRYLGFGWQPDLDDRGWRPLTISFSVGKARTSSNLSEWGKGMTFNYGSPWFFEFNFAAHAIHKIK